MIGTLRISTILTSILLIVFGISKASESVRIVSDIAEEKANLTVNATGLAGAALILDIPVVGINSVYIDGEEFQEIQLPMADKLINGQVSEDGDPLDALVLVTNPTYPGILIEARPIGLLRMRDDGEADDKIICVSTNDPRYLHTTDISNIEDHNRSEIAHFFQVYKDLEGKKVEIIGWESSKKAKQVIVESIKRYKDTLKKY